MPPDLRGRRCAVRGDVQRRLERVVAWSSPDPTGQPGGLIYTVPGESNLRVVDVLEEDDDYPERFKILIVEPT